MTVSMQWSRLCQWIAGSGTKFGTNHKVISTSSVLRRNYGRHVIMCIVTIEYALYWITNMTTKKHIQSVTINRILLYNCIWCALTNIVPLVYQFTPILWLVFVSLSFFLLLPHSHGHGIVCEKSAIRARMKWIVCKRKEHTMKPMLKR